MSKTCLLTQMQFSQTKKKLSISWVSMYWWTFKNTLMQIWDIQRHLRYLYYIKHFQAWRLTLEKLLSLEVICKIIWHYFSDKWALGFHPSLKDFLDIRNEVLLTWNLSYCTFLLAQHTPGNGHSALCSWLLYAQNTHYSWLSYDGFLKWLSFQLK